MNELQTIDWANCLELSNNKENLAKELLQMFVADLPASSAAIENAFNNQDTQDLANQAHRLHGACCYVGVPKLRSTVRLLESAAKTGDLDSCVPLLQDMRDEIKAVTELVAKGGYDHS